MCAGGTSNCLEGNQAELGRVAQEEDGGGPGGAKAAQAAEPVACGRQGGPTLSPSRHLSTFAGKPKCSRPVVQTCLPLGKSTLDREVFSHSPEVQGGEGRWFPADGQWESHLPRAGLGVTCRRDAAHPHLPPTSGCHRRMLAPPPGQNPKLLPVTGWVPGETLGCFQLEGGHSCSGRP